MNHVSTVALGDAGLAAIAVLLGCYEAWLYYHRPRHREHLWLTIICLATAVHAGLLVFHHDATPELAVKLLKGEFASIIVMGSIVPFFAMDKVNRRMPVPRWCFAASGLVWLALVPTPWVVPDQVHLRHYWLLDHPFPRRVDTPLSVLGTVYGLALVAYTAWWLWKHQAGQEREARHFAVGVVGWGLVAAYSGIFGALGWQVPMSTFEYGFVFFALALVASDARRYMHMLASSERDFRAIVARSPEAVAILQSGEIRHANPAFVKTLGYQQARQVEGRSLDAVVSPADADQVESLLELGVASPVTNARFVRDDGGQVELELVALPIELDGAPATVLLARNVTERKRLTARTMEMDRIISMGTLAAGIGHEINNPLAYVLLNLEEAKRHLRSDARSEVSDAFAECIDSSLDGVRRIRTIADGLAFFSRTEREQQPLLLNRVIGTAVDITANQVKLRAQLELDLEPELRVRANDTRLVQVFVNLLVNAAQAIPEGHVEENAVIVRTRRTKGGHIVCEVSDSGEGIAAQDLERIFEPFFTTKARGDGTGLGLGICRDTLQQMGGTISVESTPGEGTTFRLQLPECREELPRARPMSSFPPPRRLRVLVVDDEPQLLRALGRLLEHWTDVTTASSAGAAMGAIAHNEPFDVVLTDLMMPGRSGMDLFAQAVDADPELAERFVFMTGGTFTAEAQKFRTEANAVFLDKPVGASELKVALEQFEARPS